MKIASCIAVLALVGACGNEDGEDDLAKVDQGLYSDATQSGGTAGFFLLTPLGNTASGSTPGTFNSALYGNVQNPRTTVVSQPVDCGNAGTLSGSPVSFPKVNLQLNANQALSKYRTSTLASNLGMTTLGTCHRITVRLDGAALGFTEVQVLAGAANALPAAGYKKVTTIQNVVVDFRLEGNLDTDGDGVLNHVDNCPNVANANQDPAACAPVSDVDGDGVADNIDNCPNTSNADQTNADADSAGFACESCDNDPAKLVPGVCGCGVADTDSDNDGFANCIDGCPNDASKTAAGVCGCGVPDTDSDFDGRANCIEQCNPFVALD